MTRYALLLPATLLLTACPSKPQDDPRPAPPSAQAAATSSSAPARPSATPSAAPPATITTAAPARARVQSPRSFDALKAELAKKCPAKLDGNNMEMKAEIEKAGNCIRRKMVADLDTVLLPLKTANPDRFKALMKEQADWNHYIESACFIEEERQWVDFASGERSDGSMRSLPYLGCIDQGMTERELYARSLAGGSVSTLVKRIEEKQREGALVKRTIDELHTKSAAFARTPPPRSPDAQSEADWPRIVTESDAMQKRTVSLAQSTCGGWPELAAALGGRLACEAKAELYFYVQGSAAEIAP